MTTEPIVEQVKQALAEAEPLLALNFDSDALTISAVLYEPRTLDEHSAWDKLTPDQARAIVPLAGRFFDSSPKVDDSLTEEEALACIAQIEAMLAQPRPSSVLVVSHPETGLIGAFVTEADWVAYRNEFDVNDPDVETEWLELRGATNRFPTCSASDAHEFINEGLTRDEVVLVQIGPAHWRVEA